MSDSIKLFKCYFCLKYKSITECKTVQIKDLIVPKDICIECHGKIMKGEPIAVLLENKNAKETK